MLGVLMERPRVAGVAGGVGTTTIAVALHAIDGDVYPGGMPVHVLVCRSTMTSLASAQAAAAAAAASGWAAVLAVVSDGGALTPPMRASLRMVEPHVAGIVHIPHVPGLRDLVRPWDVTAHVLSESPPRELRRFTAAVARLAEATATALLRAGGPYPVGPPAADPLDRASVRPWPLAI